MQFENGYSTSRKKIMDSGRHDDPFESFSSFLQWIAWLLPSIASFFSITNIKLKIHSIRSRNLMVFLFLNTKKINFLKQAKIIFFRRLFVLLISTVINNFSWVLRKKTGIKKKDSHRHFLFLFDPFFLSGKFPLILILHRKASSACLVTIFASDHVFGSF